MAKRILIAAGLLALYGTFLEYAPIYLAHDEALNGVNAHSIVSSSGRDPNGRLLPLYFFITDKYWATPIVAYFTALFLTVLPVSEFAIRFASVVVGLTSIGLIYVVAKQIFQRERLALLAAGLLALTPAHFIHSRLAVDQLYPVPFVLGWLWCLAAYLQRKDRKLLIAAACLLGVGVYSYLASLVMMPLYFVFTAVALYQAGHRSVRPYVLALVAFLIPILPLVPWHLTHPTQFGHQMQMYDVYNASALSPLQGLRELLSYSSVSSRTSAYYQAFNPSTLFFTGGSSLLNGTSRTGVFLFPLAVFLPVGIYRLAVRDVSKFRSSEVPKFRSSNPGTSEPRNPGTPEPRNPGTPESRNVVGPMNVVLLAGLASAPLAGALVEEVTVNRMLVILPFASLVSACGAEHLLTASARSRAAALVLLALVPAQFAFFYADYMGDYRRRSAVWFERNIRGAVAELVALDQQEPRRAVYLSTSEIPFIDWFWRFYLAKYGREDLLQRTVYFSAYEVDPQTIVPGAVVLTNVDGALKQRLDKTGAFHEIAVIHEEDGRPSFALLQR